MNCKVDKASKWGEDKRLAQELFTLSEEMVKDYNHEDTGSFVQHLN